MNLDVRWRQRLNSYSRSIESLEEVYARRANRELDRVELQALVKSFELCYETGWNLMKDWLEYQGTTDISGSRDAIRAAYSAGLIADGDGWMQMLRTRNRTSHTYNETVAREVEARIVEQYRQLFHDFAATMRRRGREEDDAQPVGEIPGLSGEQNTALRDVFRRHPDVDTVLLYGSRAKGTHKTTSDIDLCITSPSIPLESVLSIEGAIDDLLLPFQVDVSVYSKIDNPELREHIDRVGVVVYRRPAR